MTARPTDAVGFFNEDPVGVAVLDRVRSDLRGVTRVTERVSATQVGFHRRRGFAWLWVPGRVLRRAAPPVVLSLALGRSDGSVRWKEVAHPSPKHWIHHLEVLDPDEIDDEVGAWLVEAADRA